MNPSEVVNGDDDPFTLLLARYSEALSAGGDAEPAAHSALSAELRQRLQRALSCVRLLRQFRSQFPRPDAVTKVIAKGSTLHDDLVGRQMGRFQVLSPLGYGGGGIVFLAYDPDLRREVALKVPHLAALLAPGMRRRFLREARAAAQLDHPNLVPVYEVGEANGLCFLVSAYCRGGSLAQWLAARITPVPHRLAAEWLAVLADAVQYVHEHGVYHRDIKPGNILLDPRSGDCFTPRLADFGLAKLREAQTEATRSGTVLGTPLYMAPEQVEGRLRDIGPTTDVYGLGAVLYELLTGRPPFRGVTDADTLLQVLMEEPAPPRHLRRDMPSDLQTICLKCLEKDPARRYGSAAELANELHRFLNGEPIQAWPLRPSERLRKWVRRRPAKAVLLASSLLIALLLGIGWSQLESLEQTRDAERTAAGKQIEEHQKAIRQKEQRLRQHRYADDIAQAWQLWENRRLEYIAAHLDKYRPSSVLDNAEDLRSFEWYFLSRLARAAPRVVRHSALLSCVAFSPDGATCAAGHEDGVIALWDPASGRQSGMLKEHKVGVYSLAYSPDGRYLVSGSGRTENDRIWGELLLWDMRTQKVLHSFPGSWGAIDALAFSPDGRTLASVVNGGGGVTEVKLWAITSGALRCAVPFAYPTGAASTAFSSDGMTLVVGHIDGKISLCNAKTGQVLGTHPGHQARAWSVACGHKEAVFVSGGEDGRVRLCSLRPGGSLLAEYHHDDAVWSVALSPDDRSVASVSHNLLKVWDRENHCERFSCALRRAGQLGKSVAFAPDGKTLVVGSEDGSMWMNDFDVLCAVESHSWLGHHDGQGPREAWAIVFSPDGKLLASAGDDHRIRLWEPATGRELATLSGHQSLVTSLAFSPDGRLLASGSFDKKAPVKLWETASGKEIATLNGHTDRVDSVVFSPDGKLLVSAGRDRIVRLWDVATHTQLSLPSRHWLDSPGQYVESLAFSPEGLTLALASNGRAPFLWDMRERKLRRTLPPHPPGHVAVAFSPDGKTLVTGGREGMMRFLDIATGELRFSARSHTDVVNCLVFAPDGKTLASAGFDKKVKLWQVSTGRELLTLPEQKDRVRWLAFSPDGTMLATAGHDGILKIYRADKTVPRP